jgi:hypothetical protein
MDSSYMEDDPADAENPAETSGKTTVILLSCLLALTTACFISVGLYFYCRWKKDTRSPHQSMEINESV